MDESVQTEQKEIVDNSEEEKETVDESKNDCSWLQHIKTTLGSLDHEDIQSFISSIPRVSAELRKPNHEAYSPKLVSIGPIHRGTRSDLLAMEKHKWDYMLALLERTKDPVQALEECGTVILGLDYVVRASYGDNIKYESHELAKIMLLDGCFLLELLIRCSPPDMAAKFRKDESYHEDSGENKKMLSLILTDLILLENQIPFFVLKALGRKLFPDVFESEGNYLIADLALSLFGYPSMRSSSAAHFLHLFHLSFIMDEGQKVKEAHREVKIADKELKRCATKLRAAGVTIAPAKKYSSNRFHFGIKFRDGVLKIPPLHVEEATKTYMKNFIAWEQSKVADNRQFTSYALFFKGLICSLHDIELLIRKKVIVKDAKIGNQDLLTFFDTNTKGVDQMDSRYTKLCKKLNTYSAVKTSRFHIMLWHYCRLCVECLKDFCKCSYSSLIHDIIPNVWKLIGIVAGAVLLALTIMQTYYSARG